MLVSIIIPAYNAQKYIEECLESAEAQTYKDTEIILVNDGSTDFTGLIAEEYWSVKIINKENGGPASALNAGIKASKGEWIKWLSADDVMNPDCIEILMNNVKDKKTIYYTNYDIIDEHGARIKTFNEPVRPESDLWKLFYGNGSSSIMHKTVFELCGLFDSSLRHSEDYEFWLRATQIYGVKLKLIPEVTIQYRRHPEQLTNKVGGSLDKTIKDSIRTWKP